LREGKGKKTHGIQKPLDILSLLMKTYEAFLPQATHSVGFDCFGQQVVEEMKATAIFTLLGFTAATGKLREF